MGRIRPAIEELVLGDDVPDELRLHLLGDGVDLVLDALDRLLDVLDGLAQRQRGGGHLHRQHLVAELGDLGEAELSGDPTVRSGHEGVEGPCAIRDPSVRVE